MLSSQNYIPGPARIWVEYSAELCVHGVCIRTYTLEQHISEINCY